VLSSRVALAFVLGLGLLLGAARARAEIPQDWDGEPVVDVDVAGEVAAMTDARAVGIPLGAPLNRALIRAAIERLISTGRFTNVQIDGERVDGGVRLIVRLTPRIELLRVQISGTHALDETVVRDALRLTQGSELSMERLPELSRAITAAYAERGYLGASAELNLRDTDVPARKVLMVRVSEGAPTRIEDIRFQGEQPLDPVVALQAMDSGEGDILDRRALAEGVTRVEAWLREHGFLEAALKPPLVTVERTRARVVIPSFIGPRYEVVIRGGRPFTQSEIRGALGARRQRLTRTVLRSVLPARLKDFCARHGYRGTRVDVLKAGTPEPNRALLVVGVDAGKPVQVVAVSFAGARHFSREFLRDQLFSYLSEKLPGSTILGTVDSEVADELSHGQSRPVQRQIPPPPRANPEEIYYEPVYEEAIAHITRLYQADGYLSARVGPPTLRTIGKDRGAVLIPVTEGPRTRLHDVMISGAHALTHQELLGAAGLQRRQPFSHLQLEEARLRMVEHYQERGYSFAKVEASVRFSRDRTRAEVRFEVVERFEVHVDQILIRGTERTDQDLVREVLELEPGDLFRPSAARESERQLSSLGVFTGVSVELQEPELPARVKSVVVTLSERRNQFLDFSAGVSTGQGARGGFEYGYRNLFGRAVSLTLRTQFAYQFFFVDDVFEERFRRLESVEDQLERRISLGASIPRTPGLGPVRTSIDLVHLRDNQRDFGLDKNGAGLTFSHSPIEYLTLTLGGDIENNNVDLFVGEALEDYLRTVQSPRTRRLLRVPEGSSTLIAARSTMSYDRRDSAFTPTRGWFVSTTFELARTLTSDPDDFETQVDQFVSRFLKVSVTASGYMPVSGGVVLAAQARAGRIFHLLGASQTYPNRAFFLGGVDTMRGFLQDTLIPQDVAEQVIGDENLSPNAIVRSGDAFVLFRGEVRFPIYGQLQGGVFTDLGNLWADPANQDPFQLRPTAGLGLRLATPVGPIALDYGFNLKRRAALDERPSALHFSIGLF
jgi:outer membrane protein assembly complex protein YaeT